MKYDGSDIPIRKAKICLCLQGALLLGASAQPAFAGVVQNCGDGGPGSGSLRDVVASASPGETIDLSQLPSNCGMADSTITLSSGEIVIAQTDLKLQGPSVGTVSIFPAQGSHSRVLDHTGSGVLVISDLRIARGEDSDAGGCIASRGDVLLVRSDVGQCSVGGGAVGRGGGIYAWGSIALLDSRIKYNNVIGLYGGEGGGLFAGEGITMINSSITGNSASSAGGSAYVSRQGSGSTGIYYSTMDHNYARICGGGFFGGASASFSNSTISYNTADFGYAGMCFYAGGAAIRNTTVAFNSSVAGGASMFAGSAYLYLQSSIVARNSSSGDEADLDATHGTVVGSGNLVMVSSGNIQQGAIALTVDPMLGELRDNGGKTQTHALLPGSPAVGAGNNNGGALYDQRGPGYPRTSGASYSTDIGAFQSDFIFYDDFDPLPESQISVPSSDIRQPLASHHRFWY